MDKIKKQNRCNEKWNAAQLFVYVTTLSPIISSSTHILRSYELTASTYV
jgi:hypothetical protein